MKNFNRLAAAVMMLAVMLTSAVFVHAESTDNRKEVITQVVELKGQEPTLTGGGVGSVSTWYATTYSGKYGNELTGMAKEMYNLMVKQYVTNRKAGQYTHVLSKPYNFDAAVVGGTIIKNESLQNVENEMKKAEQMAQDAFLYDYPQNFWLKTFYYSYSISASPDANGNYKGTIKEIVMKPQENYYGASSDIARFDSAVNNVLSAVSVSGNTREKLKSIHDYICNNTWYKKTGRDVEHTSAPFFIGDKGMVCEGYAEAFKILCDKLGIPCALIVGDAGGPHMWNYVQLDDKRWYLVDATWDDGEDEIYYTYFLANYNSVGFNDKKIGEERTNRGDFSSTGIKTFTYPVLSKYEYGVHVHEWKSSYTIDKKATCTKSGSKSIHCATCSEKKNVTVIPATNHPSKKEQAKKNATCSAVGYTAGVYCSDCKTWLSGHKQIAKLAHKTKTTLTKATISKNGKKAETCTVCKQNVKTTVIYYPKTIKLAGTAYNYNGNVKTPKLTVKNTQGAELSTSSYTVSYESGRVLPGKYTVTVTFKGNYTGTKKLYFNIKPVKASGLSVTQTTCNSVTLKWNKVSYAEGYKVFKYNTSNGKFEAFKDVTGTSVKITGLKSDTAYKFKIMAYVDDESRIYSDYSSVVTGTTKNTHAFKEVLTKATLTQNGKKVTKCADCGKVTKTTVIYYPKTITLAGYTYNYNGNVKTPKVTVKNGQGASLLSGSSYTVAYEAGRNLPGRYTVTVTFKGNYTGVKNLYFTVKPEKTTKITATQAQNSLTLKWNKVNYADGYRIYKYDPETKTFLSFKDVAGTSLVINNLKAGTGYRFKIRAYTEDNGRIYGDYSYEFKTATRPIAVEASGISSPAQGRVTLSWNDITAESGYEVYYSDKIDTGYKMLGSYKANVLSATKTGLISGKIYYFKVRAFRTTPDGNVYGAWSAVKSVKVK